jgi:hypothetical protein
VVQARVYRHWSTLAGGEFASYVGLTVSA